MPFLIFTFSVETLSRICYAFPFVKTSVTCLSFYTHPWAQVCPSGGATLTFCLGTEGTILDVGSIDCAMV